MKAGGNRSRWTEVLSGIPQGSVLGPVLFLAYIADLAANIPISSSIILKYIDDTKVIKEIKDMTDIENLQDELDSMYEWQVENNMRYNGAKFQVVNIGRNEEMRESVLFTDGMNEVITQCEQVKDLGVMIDDEASFKPQLIKAVKKAKAKSSWVLRTFITREKYEMVTLWKSLIRPHLDYCSQLWAPSTVSNNINLMESVQRAYTKRIKGMFYMECRDILKALGLLSTERRTQRYRIIYCWKFYKELYRIAELKK